MQRARDLKLLAITRRSATARVRMDIGFSTRGPRRPYRVQASNVRLSARCAATVRLGRSKASAQPSAVSSVSSFNLFVTLKRCSAVSPRRTATGFGTDLKMSAVGNARSQSKHARVQCAAQLRPEADTARRWPAGRAGSSTHKVGGRHAARIVDRAPLRGALYSSRHVRASQASRRVGFGTWALAVQLRPKPLGGPNVLPEMG